MRGPEAVTYSVSTLVGGAIVVVCVVLGFRECRARDAGRQELRKIFVERCRGTPEEAQRVYPYPGDSDP
jgi:hypothetical protein